MSILFLGHAGRDLGPFEQFIHPDDRPSFHAAQASGAFRPASFDCRMAHPAGFWLWTRWILASGPSQLQEALQELWKGHDGQLIRSQKAETASVLVSGLCHDFNNLIAAIAACAASLAQLELPADQRDTVASILQAAERSHDLVRQLQDFAHKDQEAPKTVRCVNGLMREAASLLAHMHAKGVRLETELCPELMDKIYAPFFTTKPAGHGTGLGLSMAQAIVKKHDGCLQCQSEPGHGTRFRILLPEVRPTGAPRPLRVLLVEDAEADSLLTMAALRAGGFAPRHQRVETGEALALALAEDEWDLILADHLMPRFDGFSALALARERAPHLPFIFLSGAMGEAFTERALLAGARDCVPKHRLDLLCQVVERALGRSPAREPDGAG
jgi:CheY-like chemotaxis protein